MRAARLIHRTIAPMVGLFSLYVAATGCLLQLTDLRALLGGAPATSANLEAIRESVDGPPNYVVIDSSFYGAAPLPLGFDCDAALGAVLNAAHKIAPKEPIHYVELLESAGETMGQVEIGSQVLHFQAGPHKPQMLNIPAAAGGRRRASLHNRLKSLHRMFGDAYAWINCLIGGCLLILATTGLLIYGRMLIARVRTGRAGLFWRGGEWWRALHRAIALLSAFCLAFVAVTGIWLSVDSFISGRYLKSHMAAMMSGRAPDPMAEDESRPLADSELPAMLHASLQSYAKDFPGRPVKAIRLRAFAGMPQGVIIAGGDKTSQVVYDTQTRKSVSETEPGYPKTVFPLGWQIHETVKRLHRGDYFGLSGRFTDLAASLALIYLSISGLSMSWTIERRRWRTRT